VFAVPRVLLTGAIGKVAFCPAAHAPNIMQCLGFDVASISQGHGDMRHGSSIRNPI